MSAAGAVHLACVRVADLLQDAPPPTQWLSASEAARLAGMQAAQRREQFLAGRWLLRQLLAWSAGGTPGDWPLEARADAPPGLAERPDLHLSLSHSHGWTACAVADVAVGIDLEASPRRRRDIPGLVGLCCTGAEQALFAGATHARAEALFHELWTVKEAWLKRRHEGIAPARLRQLEAREDAGGAVRAWRTADWQLALCAPAGAGLRWWTPMPPSLRAWAVRDAADAALRPA